MSLLKGEKEFFFEVLKTTELSSRFYSCLVVDFDTVCYIVMTNKLSTDPRIPVIDISGGDSEVKIAEELVHAATLHGFVYIKNQGKDISVQDIDTAFGVVGL